MKQIIKKEVKEMTYGNWVYGVCKTYSKKKSIIMKVIDKLKIRSRKGYLEYTTLQYPHDWVEA